MSPLTGGRIPGDPTHTMLAAVYALAAHHGLHIDHDRAEDVAARLLDTGRTALRASADAPARRPVTDTKGPQ